MFRFEKDMIPVLIEHLSILYNTEYFIPEFNTGNGVADLVLATGMNNEDLILDNYRLMALYFNHFYNKKELKKSDLFTKVNSKFELNQLLKALETWGYIDNEDGSIRIKKNINSHVKSIIAIEAKLKDWKSGIHQALRYQFFSQQTFLAYPANFIHRIDLSLIQDLNIGLMAVSPSGINIIYKPKINEPKDRVAYYHLGEYFAKSFRLESVYF